MSSSHATNDSVADSNPWRSETLDPADPAAVLAYERALFDAFSPVLKINPLIRDLWDWDDAARRLRTRAPYADQFVALLRDPSTGDLLYSIAANLHPQRFWQSGAYDFPVPAPAEHACEILITATSQNKTVHGPAVLHRFIHAYFFQELRRRGFRCAYLTSADHLRWLYRRFGARVVDEKTIHGLRRTLFRWEFAPPDLRPV